MSRIITGPPVRKGDLYGREMEIERLWSLLEHGHVLLTAPRRYGKTSLMYGLADQPREGWTVVFSDIEFLEDPADLLEAVLAGLLVNQPIRRALRGLKGLPPTLGRWLRAAFEAIEVGAGSVGQVKLSLRDNRPEEDWLALGRLVTDLLACLPSKQRYLVILDEFPLFVTALFRRSERLAVHFLQWFRATRQSFEQTHFLLGGSINLEGSLASSGHSALVNDLEVFRVRPFPAEVANRFVQHLLAGQIDTSREQLEAIAAEITGVVGVGVPFYLQLVTGQLVDAIRLDAAPISRETVRWVYDERVLGPDCRVRFDHYRSRLSEYYDPDNLTRARLILDVLCDGEEHEEAEILDRLRAYGLEIGADGAEATRVLAQLEADYYIECRGGRVRFLHRILADWWQVNIRPPARGC